MQEFIALFNLFSELGLFVGDHKKDTELTDYYLFTIKPDASSQHFDDNDYTLFRDHIPSDLSCSIKPNIIEFSATEDEEEKLTDAFAEILRLIFRSIPNTTDDSSFYSLLESCDNQVFTRLLEKYKLEKKLFPEKKIVETTEETEEAVSEEAVSEEAVSIEEIIEELPPSPPTIKNNLSFWQTSATKASQEDKLTWGLQSDLENIVRQQTTSIEPTAVKHLLDLGSAVRNLSQKAKNWANVHIGNAEAAINIVERFKHYSDVVDRLFNYQEINEIKQLVTDRLSHIQQDHLKDTHAEEITYLKSAETRVQKILSCLTARGAIQLPEYDAPSTLASPGYHS